MTYGIFGGLRSFDDYTIEAVWQKARPLEGNNPAIFRQDACGAWIKRDHYGSRLSQWGWEIDHIVPDSKGGSDSIWNLQPLHWKNNAAKGDGALVCAVRASGAANYGV